MEHVLAELTSLLQNALIIAPRKTRSVPARIGTQRSAIADVRVKRGSTWMIVPPRSRAWTTKRKPTGCCSAMDEPMMRIASALARSGSAVVAPPRPNEVPRPGTVALCHIRA